MSEIELRVDEAKYLFELHACFLRGIRGFDIISAKMPRAMNLGSGEISTRVLNTNYYMSLLNMDQLSINKPLSSIDPYMDH